MIQNPNDDPLLKRIEALEELLFANPLRNAAFGSGGIEVYGGGVIRFTEGGGINIESDGYINVDGNITGEGHFDWTGEVDLRGPVHITGENGTLTVDADTLLKGLTKLQADLQVEGTGKIIVGAGGSVIILDGATGKITAGNLTIDPSSNGGSLKFSSGPEVYANGHELSLYSGGAWITLTNGLAKISSGGLTWLEISPTGFKFVGLQTIRKSDAGTGAFVGALVANASGVPFRVVAD